MALTTDIIDSLKRHLDRNPPDTIRARALLEFVESINDDKVRPVYNDHAPLLSESRLPSSPGREEWVLTKVKANALNNMDYLHT